MTVHIRPLSWFFALLVALALPAAAQPHPQMMERIRSLITALNGAPEAFESYVQQAYSKALVDKRTPEQRRAFVESLQKELGQLQAGEIQRLDPARVSIAISGSTGVQGKLVLEHEPQPPFRITALEMRIGGGGGEERPPLPAVPVRGDMAPRELGAAVDGYVARLAGEDKFSGTVLIARDGETVFAKAYGLANRSDSVPNRMETRFNVGSITKSFTKVAIGQLAAAGKLSLDDSLGEHLPDHPNAEARAATIQQLLDHTAGLGDFMSPEFRETSKDRFRSNHDWYTFVAPQPLVFPPGQRNEYCNNCYMVLGEIVERVSGMPYEQYLQRHVFEPAGMRTAGFFAADAIVPNVAVGYTNRLPGGPRSNVLTRGAAGSAAGSTYATAADLLAFDNALREGKLLDAKWTAWLLGGTGPSAGRADTGVMFAGGLQGVNAVLAANGRWTVIALANLDPPAAEALGEAIFQALTK